MEEENPEMRSMSQDQPAIECLEEFVLGLPVKPYSEHSMSDVLSSSSSKKYSSSYHEASGAHHHLVEKCSQRVFVFDAFQDRLKIRMLPFGEHRGDGESPDDSKCFDLTLKNEVIVSGMMFFSYSSVSKYYGTVLIPVESGIIYQYYLSEDGLMLHPDTGQHLRAIFKLNAPAPPLALEKSEVRPPVLNCLEVTSSGRSGFVSTAGSAWKTEKHTELNDDQNVQIVKQEVSVAAHYHFKGSFFQSNKGSSLGLVLYRFYIDPDPLVAILPTEEARELVNGETVTISTEKQGFGGLVRSIFAEQSSGFDNRTVVESIRNLGDYLLGMILNCEGEYEACVLNLKSCQIISRRQLPSIPSEFAYDVVCLLTSDATNRLRPFFTQLGLYRVHGSGHIPGYPTSQRHLEAEQQTW